MTAPGKSRSYRIETEAQARAAISKVKNHGTAAERKKVFAAVKVKYPNLAQRSTTIPTKSGSGRRKGQPAGARNKAAPRKTKAK
jgi:hypothetical protein